VQHRSIFTALLVLALTALSASAGATVMVLLSRQELAQRSELIVRGRVVGQRHAWNEDHTSLLTLSDVRVDEYLKGHGAQTLVVRQRGGQVGDLVQRVPGRGELRVGEEAVLLLRSGPGVVYLSEMAQSLFYIRRTGGNVTAHRDLSDASFVPSPNNTSSVTEGGVEPAVPLATLVAELRRLGGGAR
jgi:hypothetical protein